MRRLLSLDVFRGVTIASMILVNNPGTWDHVYAPLRHADWHGWTFTDLVFPFFLWMVGLSMTFSFTRRVEQGADRRQLFLHAARRAATIFLIGFLFNLVPAFDFAHVRIPGVLQRIGLCYLLGSALYLSTNIRGLQVTIALLLAGYTALMTPGGYEKASNFVRDVDTFFLTGHIYNATKYWDPEGIVSTLPALATCLFGALAGHLIRSQKSIPEKTAWLYFWGTLALLAGLLLDPFQPINKNLWTASYCLFMAGMAHVCFAGFFWLCDGTGIKTPWLKPFEVFGSNAIALYILSGLLARVLALTGAKAWLWTNLYQPLAADLRIGSVAFALTEVLALYAVAEILYRRKIFIRL